MVNKIRSRNFTAYTLDFTKYTVQRRAAARHSPNIAGLAGGSPPLNHRFIYFCKGAYLHFS
jgi:hypothetical protein